MREIVRIIILFIIFMAVLAIANEFLIPAKR
jgi:hypothetical protein